MDRQDKVFWDEVQSRKKWKGPGVEVQLVDTGDPILEGCSGQFIYLDRSDEGLPGEGLIVVMRGGDPLTLAHEIGHLATRGQEHPSGIKNELAASLWAWRQRGKNLEDLYMLLGFLASSHQRKFGWKAKRAASAVIKEARLQVPHLRRRKTWQMWENTIRRALIRCEEV